MRVGLVLGGDGALGLAYHAGVLAALEHDLGWDARRAAVIVGTSAGALTGGLLARGMTAGAIAAWDIGRRDVRSPAALPDPASLPVLDPGGGDRHRRAVDHLQFLDELPPHEPEPPLWITAVRQRDTCRIVFGRTARTAPLSLAVAASCAVPGDFEPVRIGGERYIDGGAHSATNADLLEHEQLDLVIAITPLTTPGRRRATRYDAMRRINGRRLRTELARLERGGRRTLLFEPAASSIAATGPDPMDRDLAAEVVRAAFLETGTTLARTRTRIVRGLEDDRIVRRRGVDT